MPSCLDKSTIFTSLTLLCFEIIIFVTPNETETSSAEEQFARDS